MPTRPNVVLILTDQQRADFSGREGFPLDTTPFADELAEGGVWFDRAYTTSPLCSPARTSLLTGRFPSAHRVRENPGAADAVFTDDLFSVLRRAGYATALVGKNHTYLTADDVDYHELFMHGGGLGTDRTDEERRFDSWLTGLRHRTPGEAAPFPAELQGPHRIVTAAQRWVDSLEGRPFFLLLSFPEPHNPYQVSEPYFSLFRPEDAPPRHYDDRALTDRSLSWRYLRRLGEAADPDYAHVIGRARASYCGMLRLIDDQVRRLVDHLDGRSLRDRTLLFVTADHGDFAGEYGLLRKGAELPEVLVRIPLVVNGPGVLARPDAHPAHVSLADLAPTVFEATGVEPTGTGIQGRSLWPLLTGRNYPADEFASAYAEQGMGGLPYADADVPAPMPGLGAADDEYDFDELNAVTQSGQRRMVRASEWKLVADNLGVMQLYHLPSDPYETRNLWDEPSGAGVRDRMLQELVQWMLRAEDPLPVPTRGYARKRDRRNYRTPYRPRRSR